MKKAIITGATGMIGVALTNLLVENGVECLVLNRKNSNRLNRLPKSDLVKCFDCELSDLSSFDYKEKDFDTFFHLGWTATRGNTRNDANAQLDNIKYTLDAVDLANRLGCKTFVGAGSQAEYGFKTEKLSSKLLANPETGYGIAKYSAGKLSRLKANQLGMKHCWSRILSIYGPYDDSNTLISYLINSLLDKQSPTITKCEQVWDYLYVKDCANALYLIAEKGINGKVYPIGSGRSRLLKDYVEDIKNNIDKKQSLSYGSKEYLDNQVMYLCADTIDLENDTQWKPKYTFKEGIKETIDFYRSER